LGVALSRVGLGFARWERATAAVAALACSSSLPVYCSLKTAFAPPGQRAVKPFPGPHV
jgi:hypothetical protein